MGMYASTPHAPAGQARASFATAEGDTIVAHTLACRVVGDLLPSLPCARWRRSVGEGGMRLMLRDSHNITASAVRGKGAWQLRRGVWGHVLQEKRGVTLRWRFERVTRRCCCMPRVHVHSAGPSRRYGGRSAATRAVGSRNPPGA